MLLSCRASRMRMSDALTYEFEDVLAGLLGLSVWSSGVPTAGLSRHVWRVSRPISRTARRRPSELPLVIAVGQNQHTLADHIDATPVLRTAKKKVAIVDEMWADELPLRPSTRRYFARFDRVFLGTRHACDELAEHIERPVHYLPHSVDMVRFTSGRNPQRAIDVYAMGRRNPAQHDALRAWADREGTLYLYDTFIRNPRVSSIGEHRSNLASLIRRTLVFLVDGAKANRRSGREHLSEIGFRYFEGAAGGAILVGTQPSSPAFEQLFGWEEAVLPARADGSDIVDIVEAIREDQERASAISCRNVAGALRQHDVAHRARTLLSLLDEPEPDSVADRITKLAQQAASLPG